MSLNDEVSGAAGTADTTADTSAELQTPPLTTKKKSRPPSIRRSKTLIKREGVRESIRLSREESTGQLGPFLETCKQLTLQADAQKRKKQRSLYQRLRRFLKWE